MLSVLITKLHKLNTIKDKLYLKKISIGTWQLCIVVRLTVIGILLGIEPDGYGLSVRGELTTAQFESAAPISVQYWGGPFSLPIPNFPLSPLPFLPFPLPPPYPSLTFSLTPLLLPLPGPSPLPSLLRGSGGVNPGKFFKVYFAVGEFKLILDGEIQISYPVIRCARLHVNLL